MFRTSILVRFGDLDAAGIAYYPNLVNFLHEALVFLARNTMVMVDMPGFRPTEIPPWLRKKLESAREG